MSAHKKQPRAWKFRTSQNWGLHWRSSGEPCSNQSSLKYGSDHYDREMFISVIENEYALRELVQRLEFLRKKIKGLEKMADSEADNSQLAQLNTELEEAQKKHALQTYQHYKAESLVAGHPFKAEYDSLRQDPSWYMRYELVQDCKSRGGCCGRACGCCAQRHLSSNETKGIGHCTWDCYCCVYYRGFEFSKGEKEEARREFKELLRRWNASCLLIMTNAFFTKVEPESKPEPDSNPTPGPIPDSQTQHPWRWARFWKR